MMYVRDCAKCGDTKPVGEFYLRKRKCGPMFQPHCKACEYQRTKPLSLKNAAAHKARRRRNNPEAVRREKARERWRQHLRQTDTDTPYAQYLQRRLSRGRNACLLAAALNRIDQALWLPVRIVKPRSGSRGGRWSALPGESPAERYRRLYQTDPAFAANERLRRQAKKHDVWGCIQSRIRDAVKSKRPKGGTLFEFLGYSADDLKQHIERQFDRRMSWQRFMSGEIHIDHVRPVASFDLSSESQIKECWALPNLRPCWKSENIRKGAREEFLL